MINLAKKLKTGKDDDENPKRVSTRDRLLAKEIPELEELPDSITLNFDDPDKLHEFDVTIKPAEGFWEMGEFKFHVDVPQDYNMVPPAVKCLTKLWHPNINEDGGVCLSILRVSAIDDKGWSPIRQIKDVLWGLYFLFTDDLLNFEDPLNREAADQHAKDPVAFRQKVNEYIRRYCTDTTRRRR